VSERDGVELVWPGKYGPDGRRAPIAAPAAHLVDRERIPARGDGGAGRLVLGDNLAGLAALAPEIEGAVDLAYIDPPFATGTRFRAARPFGAGRGRVQLPAFTDRWPGGLGDYLAALDPRVRLIHRLLAPHGSIYVHVDPGVGHAVKLLLDDVFGAQSFQREIVWRIGWLSGYKTRARNWIRNHDVILFYTKHPTRFTFNKAFVPHPPGYRRRDGRPARGPGIPLEDVWNANPGEHALTGRASLDSIQIKSLSREKTGWATQKNESVLARIVAASSDPGDLVLDAFGGSGTTAVVASRLGRRFVSCDASELAILIARGRLLDEPGCGELRIGEVAGTAPGGGPTRVELEARGDGRELQVRLVGARVGAGPWPRRGRRSSWSDALEAWAVDFSGRDAFVSDFEARRREPDRALALESGPHRIPAGTREIAVRLYDALGRGATHRFVVQRRRSGWKLAARSG
jgi:DNA modification methylase